MAKVDEAFELRYRLGKEEFELLVDFEKLNEFRKKPSEVELNDVLADWKIFKNQKKGEIASETSLKIAFPQMNEEEIIRKMLLEGECQIPTAHLNKLREETRTKISNYIADNAINPQTKKKYSRNLIEGEIAKLKFNINIYQSHEVQAEEVLKLLKKIMPITIDKSTIKITIPGQYCGAFYGNFRAFGKTIKEYFDQEGNLKLQMQISSGKIEDVIEFTKKHTNNEAEYQVLNE